MQDLVEFFSLTLTVPTLLVGAWVLWIYGPAAIQSLNAWTHGSRPEYHALLIVGIAVGFLGSVLDNAYWGAAWSAEFFDHQSRDDLFKYGVWSNVPFRQGAGILAGSLHVWAQVRDSESGRKLFMAIWVFTVWAGIALAVAR